MTLRRRGKELIKNAIEIPDNKWKIIPIDSEKRKHRIIRVHDGFCKLRNDDEEVRQIIVTE